jgi:hypothetical protein
MTFMCSPLTPLLSLLLVTFRDWTGLVKTRPEAESCTQARRGTCVLACAAFLTFPKFSFLSPPTFFLLELGFLFSVYFDICALICVRFLFSKNNIPHSYDLTDMEQS